MQVANNWNVSLAEGSIRLELFSKKHESEDLYKEFLVRGVASKEKTVITVIPEAKVKAYQNKLDSFSKTLFAVAKRFPCNKTPYYKLEPTKVIRFPLDLGPLKTRAVHVIPPPRPVMEKEKKKNIFAAPAGGSKKAAKAEKKPEAKKSPEEQKPYDATPKKEETATKASSSTKKSPAKRSNAKGKQIPKVQMGKGSISSFFGQKTSPESAAGSATQPKKESPPSQVQMAKKVEPKKEEKKSPIIQKKSPIAEKPIAKEVADDATRKRNLSSDRGSESDKKNKSMEEPSSKKAKKEVKTKKVEKRSRIMAICDSDSSDGETPVVGKHGREDSEEEADPKPSKKPPMEQKKASPDENRNPAAKKRLKATRKVTKSYEDEDGFIRTVRETEEYSCSEEEVVEVKRSTGGGEGSSKPSSSALKPKAPTKQGSIMSFFGKK